jgi:hypothetical protein
VGGWVRAGDGSGAKEETEGNEGSASEVVHAH